MAVEQKVLDTTQNIKSQEQLKAKNDILSSVQNYTSRLKDKQKAELINQLAPQVLQAIQ